MSLNRDNIIDILLEHYLKREDLTFDEERCRRPCLECDLRYNFKGTLAILWISKRKH